MKKFFAGVLSSFVGTWIAIGLFSVVVILVVISLIGGLAVNVDSDIDTSIEDNTLLVLNLSGEVVERDINKTPNLFSLAQGDIPQIQSLQQIREVLDNASKNNKIDALYINCNGISASSATLNAIRESVIRFKESGKKIYAYADNMFQSDYYIACIADSIYANPYGSFSLSGLNGVTPYYKGLFDKIGIEFQVVKVGTYKSAVEPYILTSMSEPARAQLDTLYSSMWNTIKQEISKSRNLNPALIDTLINNDFISTRSIEFVLSKNLIDKLYYKHEVEQQLAKIFKKEKFEEINVLSIDEYSQLMPANTIDSNNQIAVLYAYGAIEDGNSEGIQSAELVPQILKLAEDDNVKALVMRVNSPGGSAFASEQIWEALEVFKKSGKPFAVSMGDYAASGGYYISCGADYIFADPLTITGSIGIFGLIPCAEDLLQNKLGINFEIVSTNPNGSIYLTQKMSPEMYNAMQAMVEDGYDLFTRRCAEGRGMTQEAIKAIGEGRVWDAYSAKRHGLVDEIGLLEDAINWVAQKAKLDDYNVVNYPESSDNFWNYLKFIQSDIYQSQLYGNDVDKYMIEFVKLITRRAPIQARMQDIIIKM